MATFTYKARTHDGALVKGELEGSNEPAIVRELQSQGVFPVDVREQSRTSIANIIARKRIRISLDDKILFIRQLESLITAGIPIATALRSISRSVANVHLRSMLEQVRSDIESGGTLGASFRKHPALFSPMHASLIEAGEQGGILDVIVARLGELLEYESENRARIRQALFYPAMVIGELVLAFVVILKFVFPRFKSMFASRGADLPLPTRVMIVLSDFMENHWWLLVGVTVVVAIAVTLALRTERGKVLRDRLVLRTPIFGEIALMITMSQFCRVSSSLLSSGTPFLKALQTVRSTIGNRVVRDGIAEIEDGVRKGGSIADSIPNTDVFPSTVRQMLEIGEKSGHVSEMLLQVSTFYDRQVDYKIKNLTTVIEPILLVILGASVLFVALAVFMPMWDMTRVIMGG